MAERTHFQVEGFAEIDEKFKNIALNDKQMRKRINDIIRNVLQAARNRVASRVRGAIPNDPREAYRAVRHSVYKKILGGQINILSNKRKKGATIASQLARAGNRGSSASLRTKQINSYRGAERGFILNWLNRGTEDRYTGGRSYEMQRQGRLSKATNAAGFRGKITARHFFEPAGTAEMQWAAGELEQLINEEIAKAFSE